MEIEKNDKFKAYLFGSVLWVLQLKELPDLSTTILFAGAIIAAAAVGYAVAWWKYSEYFKIKPNIHLIRTRECWRNFDRDQGMARNSAEVGQAIDNFSRCFRGELDYPEKEVND